MVERTEEKRQQILTEITMWSLILLSVSIFTYLLYSLIQFACSELSIFSTIALVLGFIFLSIRFGIAVAVNFDNAKTYTGMLHAYFKSIFVTPYHDFQFVMWLMTGKDMRYKQ